jgi:osmotically-inducible protein OsmY
MSTASLTQTDLRIRKAVQQQLEWDSQVDASAVGVAVAEGVATLTGYIDSYAGKLAAERAAKQIRGVRAVANDIQVRLRLDRTDTDIATDAARALGLRPSLPESLQATVHGGHVTLTGSVPTLFQRAVAEEAIRHIRGVKGVVNRVEVLPQPAERDIRREIARALHRDADAHGRGISVTVDEHKVTLTGTVRSWHERESAERAAMHARGITEVDNQITVAWPNLAELNELDVDDPQC